MHAMTCDWPGMVQGYQRMASIERKPVRCPGCGEEVDPRRADLSRCDKCRVPFWKMRRDSLVVDYDRE